MKPLDALHTKVPEFFSYPGPDKWVSYASRLGYPLSCAVGWTIMLPHVFVRSGYFGNDLKAQRKLLYLAPILQAIVWTGTMCVGLLGLALVSDLTAGDTELLIPYIIENIIVIENIPVAKFLMIAFFIGTCAVGLSTANAFLSVSSGIVSQDFICKTFGYAPDDKKQDKINRIIVAAIGVFSTLLALRPPELIFTLVMFAIALVMPLFPILVMGIYWKRATKQAAIAASLTGTLLVLCTYFIWEKGNTWYGAIGMLASAIVMLGVSKCTRQDPGDCEEFFILLNSGHKKYYHIK